MSHDFLFVNCVIPWFRDNIYEIHTFNYMALYHGTDSIDLLNSTRNDYFLTLMIQNGISIN